MILLRLAIGTFSLALLGMACGLALPPGHTPIQAAQAVVIIDH